MAKINAQEFAEVMESLQGKLDALKFAAGSNPSREQQKAITEAQDAITQAQASRSIQAGNDADAIYGRNSSGIVGATDALNEFIRATQDSAAVMGRLTSSTLQGFNEALVNILTTSRREGGPHFVKHQFEGLGRSVATNVSGAALSKGEGILLSGLGWGKSKPSGTAADPLYTKSVDYNMNGNGPLGFLNTGITLPNVISSGSSSSSATSEGFFGKLAGFAMHLLPAFAEGGAISANTLSMVGERGPELFMPRTSGTIVPNSKIGMGGHTFAISVDARGSGDPAQVEAAAHRAVMRAGPSLVAASLHAMSDQKRRNPLSKR